MSCKSENPIAIAPPGLLQNILVLKLPEFIRTMSTSNPETIAPPGFEPGFQAPKACELDHYSKGLFKLRGKSPSL